MTQTTWTVYMLKCADGSLYTGITNDLKKRLLMHAQGKASKYTRGRLPVDIVYQEHGMSRSQALRREYAIKQCSRHQKNDLIKSYEP